MVVYHNVLVLSYYYINIYITKEYHYWKTQHEIGITYVLIVFLGIGVGVILEDIIFTNALILLAAYVIAIGIGYLWRKLKRKIHVSIS